MYSKVKLMEHKTKIKLCVQNKDGELLTEPEQILDRWFEYIGGLYEDERTNTINHRKEKATILDKEIRDISSQCGFITGRGTWDTRCQLRIMMERCLEMQKAL